MRALFATLLLCFLSVPTLAATGKATEWGLLHDKSSIIFKVRQMGSVFEGRFDRFTARILFDPENLSASAAKVEVDISSVNTQAADRDENIRGKDWFDAAQFPSAHFETTAFRRTGQRSYEADGRLTIRNITVPITLPFTLDIVKSTDGNTYMATMDAPIVLDRSVFKLGSGSWADSSAVAYEVPVDIHVVARSQ